MKESVAAFSPLRMRLTFFFVTLGVLNVFSAAFYLRVENLRVQFKCFKSQVDFLGFRNSGSRSQ